MDRIDLQNLSRLRIREANQLLQTDLFCGAYYLAGFSVECALKACVAKQISRHDFPDRILAQQAYTHNLEQLLRVAQLETELNKSQAINPQLRLNWTTVTDWSVDSRYNLEISELFARTLYSACTARQHGVLTWIRQYW